MGYCPEDREEKSEVVRAEHKKDQLPFGGFHAVFGEPVNAHELTGGLVLPQLFFLL